jgi:hypothetical protein
MLETFYIGERRSNQKNLHNFGGELPLPGRAASGAGVYVDFESSPGTGESRGILIPAKI